MKREIGLQKSLDKIRIENKAMEIQIEKLCEDIEKTLSLEFWDKPELLKTLNKTIEVRRENAKRIPSSSNKINW